MTDTKRCTACGRDLPVSDFPPRSSTDPRLRSECRACARERIRANQERRRAEIGDDAYRAEQRERTRRSRARNGGAAEKAYSRARRRATQTLIARHRDEFDQLLAQARQDES